MDLHKKSREELIEIVENQQRKVREVVHQNTGIRAGLIFLEVAEAEGAEPEWQHIRWLHANSTAAEMLDHDTGQPFEMHQEFFGQEEKPALLQHIRTLLDNPKSAVEFSGYFITKSRRKIQAAFALEKVSQRHAGTVSLCLQISPLSGFTAPHPFQLDAMQQLHTALVNSHLLAVTTDGTGAITYCSKAFLELTEEKEEEVLGQNLFEELMPLRGEQMDIHRFVSLTSRRGFTENIKRSLRTRAGKTIDLNLISIVIHNVEQEFRGITILAEDISEQKKVRKKLQETHLQLIELFNNASDLIQIFSEKGNLLFVNKAWRSVLAYEETEVKLLNFFDLVHPHYLEATKSYLQRARREETNQKFRTILLTKNKEHVYVSGSISWKQRGNAPGEYRAIFHDISDQVKAERAQRLYNSITSMTMQSYDLDTLYFNIHRELKKVVSAENFYIALADDSKEVSFPYHVMEKNFFQDGREVESEKDLVDYVIASNQACILNEEDLLELILATVVRPRALIPQSWLGVPLTVNKRVIGLIALQNFDHKHALSEKDLDLLSFVSGQVALAIERKKNEEKLNEQTSRLNAIFESSTHLIWSVNRDFQFTSFNQNFMRVMQSHFQLGPVMHQVYNADSPKVTNEYLKQFVDRYKRAFEGRTSQFELAFSLGRDHYLWKQIFINPVQREDGSIHEVSGIAHDITQRKKSELALLESEEKFRNIFESFQDIYFRCNIDGTITMISPSITELTDYVSADVIGKNITNYYLYDSRTKNLIRKLAKNKSVRNFEATIIRADGELLQCICNVRLIQHADRTAEIEGVARDITELKKANQALQKAKDLAEKSLKVKEAFLANMSHEIRTPMNGIISMVDVLAQTELNIRQQEYVQIIRSSSETLLSILNDILDLSKMEAGKMKLKRTAISLPATIEKLYGLFSQKALTKNIHFSYHIEESVPAYIAADEVRLLQVLSNLTANALKFTPEGGKVSVHVADITDARRKQQAAEHILRIAVQDNGIGITREDQPRLFQNFSQADSSSTKKYEGTGLGLSIAKQLVELMQGSIGVESEPGKGSTFWFTFKARTSAPPAQEVRESSRAHYDLMQHAPRILLVDDNEVNRKVAREILRNAGCEVTVASSGRQALTLSQQQVFDLILMDIQMPDMDGIETTRAIKALPLSQVPPVVAMTAYSMQGDREKFLKAGLDDYLAKPIRAEELLNKIAAILGYAPSNFENTAIQNEKELKVVNQEVLKDLEKYGGLSLIYDTLTDFEKEAEELIASCFELSENNHDEEILRKLHTLKGNAGTLGVEKVSEMARIIEANLRQGRRATLAQDLLSLKEYFQEFRNHLRKKLNPNHNV